MSAALSNSAKAAWTRNLAVAGVTGYAKRVSGYGDVDYVTQERSTDTLLETDLIAIVANYSKDEILGQLVQVNDLKVTCDSTTIITKKDGIKIGTRVGRIENIREVNFGGVLVGYELQVRM